MMQHPRYVQFARAYESDEERNLWATVLQVAINDATDQKGCTHREHVEARRWIGQFPSRNFRTVCFLAGLDPDATHGRLKRALDLTDNQCH